MGPDTLVENLALSRNRRRRLLAAAGAFAAYAVVFLPLHQAVNLGAGAASLSVLPVLAAGWLLGWRWGLIAGLALWPLNTLLLNLAGETGWDVILRAKGVPGMTAAVVIGAAVGWMGELARRVRSQAHRLERERARLREQIGERQRTEEALSEREVRIRILMEQLPAILWTTDAGLGITSSLGAGLTALNLRPNELVGVSLYDYLQSRDPEFPPLAAHLRALRGEPSRYAFRWRERLFQTHVEPLLGPDGTVAGCLGLALDITAHEQAEEALRESEGRFQDLFENSPDAIFVYGLDQRLLDVNITACRLHGLPREALVGRHALELVPPDKWEEVAQVLRGLAEGTGQIVEGNCWTADGRPVPIEARSRRITYSGQPALLLHVRDVTDRRRLEDQFRQAQKMEAVGRLAGGVAHDFNNLLTSILGHCNLLLDGLPPRSPLGEGLAEIDKAGRRAADLTRQLLAFSRKQLLQPRILDLNAIVADMERLLRRSLGEDVALEILLASDLGPVKADPGQLGQVVLNLAVNARDAMPEGGRLSIETANVELDEAYARLYPDVKPGPYVRLAVRDTGCGMDEETLSHLFEPFFTTKELGKGVGLGLATVFGIVQQSGGHLTVASKPGRGTLFLMYLPRVHEAVPRPEPSRPRPPLPRGTETVLVVEDEETVRSLVRRTLETNGYAVLEASNGDDAVRVAAKHRGPIHLLLTDVIMPGMGGRELAESLCAGRPGLKVLYMSGYPDDAVVRRGVSERNTVLLSKPFRPDNLLQAARALLGAE